MRIGLVVGTRPEAIKLAPVYRALAATPAVEPVVLLSGQHGSILHPFIKLFGLDRRIALAAREETSSLTDFAGRLLSQLGDLFERERFDAIAVQGDTSSALIGALAAAYAEIPVAHVEAGLRSHDRREPFPEELNRQMLASACHWHFAPTPLAAENLRNEGLSEGIVVVGNTVIDSALWTARLPETAAGVLDAFPGIVPRQAVLVTAHRRESFGAPMRAIGLAVGEIASRHPELTFVVPLHPNPNAGDPMRAALGGLANVRLCEPLPYHLLIGLMAQAHSILSDSGGLQEEAPSFGVPMLVLRELTERPEGVERGCNRIVGTSRTKIVDGFEKLVAEGIDYYARKSLGNPYGDGRTGERIAQIMVKALA